MAGECRNCGRCGCECGRLPYTIDLSVSGLQNYAAGQTCEIPLVSCFGSGASISITSPGGCPRIGEEACLPRVCDPDEDDSGPIESISIVSRGGCYARLGREEPTLTAYARPQEVSDLGSGSEPEVATFSITLARDDGNLCNALSGKTVTLSQWRIESIEVSGGSGYRQTQHLTIDADDLDTIKRPARAVVDSESGIPFRVRVIDGGIYWRESRGAPPIVSPVWMSFSEYCGGSGAAIEGVVDSDVDSPTFGQMIDAKVLDAGDGYSGWQWARACWERMNGKTITLRADNREPACSLEVRSCFGGGACLQIEAIGERFEPALRWIGPGSATPWGSLPRGCGGSITIETEKTLTDGNEWLPVWTAVSAKASGGQKYFSGEAQPTLRDIVTLRRAYGCPVKGTLPAIDVEADGSGSLIGASVRESGGFYMDREYDGLPSPIKVVTLADGGSGYCVFGRTEPTIEILPPSKVASSITLTPTLGSAEDPCGRTYWFVESASVSGGDGTETGWCKVQATSGSTTGRPAKVQLVPDYEGGKSSASVADGGEYWKDDASLPPYVSSYSVEVIQLPPSKGSGAKIVLGFDEDTSSETFGSVTSAKIESGGSGYTLLRQSGCTYVSKGDLGSALSPGSGVSLDESLFAGCVGITAAGGSRPVTVSLQPQTALVTPIGGGATGVSMIQINDHAPAGPDCTKFSGESTKWNRGGTEGADISLTVPGSPWDACDLGPDCTLDSPYIPLLDVKATLTTRTGITVELNRNHPSYAYFFTAGSPANGGFWTGHQSGVGWFISVEETDSMFSYYDIGVSSGNGRVSAGGGWAGGLPLDENGEPTCMATSGFGCGARPCGVGDWFIGEIEFDIKPFPDPSFDMSKCPEIVGHVKVTIASMGSDPC